MKERIRNGQSIVLAGAHNALTAKLVEEAGFEGVWASGFEISAARAVPDANVLTMAEQLEVARQMAAAVQIPVIADCDSGYGDIINTIRTVEEYEKAGVAGISIEDNLFPKRCSLYNGSRPEIATIEEHTQKIRACVGARASDHFLIIARTEAFIAGFGLEEALRRGRSYADAGADLVLVHSKRATSEELAAFSARWDRDTPLVAVPTTFRGASVEELGALGYRMVIFANHGLRSAVKAIRETLAVLRSEQRTAAVEDRVVPLEDVYRLVGVERMRSFERAYASESAEKASAIILAAGSDDDLMPLVADRPKCMLNLKGRSVLERQIEALNACGVRNISVVRGYKKEAVAVPGVRYFDNDAYATTGEAASLFAAAEAFSERTIVLYGDVLFEREVLEKLLRAEAPISIVVDRLWRKGLERPLGPKMPDLVALDDSDPETASYMTLNGASRVVRIGSGVSLAEADGQFIGLAVFDDETSAKLRSIADRLRTDGAPLAGSAAAKSASLTDLIEHLIGEGTRVTSVDIRGGWMDVDSFADYGRAWASVER